ncbi:prepilin-type N-terminal cleavage/methylation domain-containing protein, partial [Achromobacter sp. Marseille-Q0513]|nr:prepilin-type N-terminal cleavage/methylation domain-containing protein [Achromobacter sp. Marseille-Q0513]
RGIDRDRAAADAARGAFAGAAGGVQQLFPVRHRSQSDRAALDDRAGPARAGRAAGAAVLRMPMRRQQGFTLIEMLAALTLLAL